jgi:hypothetical protein
MLNPPVAAGCFDFKLTFLLYQSQDDSKIYIAGQHWEEEHIMNTKFQGALWEATCVRHSLHCPVIETTLWLLTLTTVARHSTMKYQALVRLPPIFTCQYCQCGWLSLMLPLDLLVDDHASRNNARFFVLPRAEKPNILVDSCHIYGFCGTRPGSPFRFSSPQILVFR